MLFLIKRVSRRGSLGFLFLLSACTSTQHWKVSQHKTTPSVYWCFKPENAFNGVSVEIIEKQCDQVAYLGVLSREIPPYDADPTKAKVTLIIDTQNLSFLAHRMQGGQRLLLPLEATKQLISALAAKKKVVVALQGFVSELPTDFIYPYQPSKTASFLKNFKPKT